VSADLSRLFEPIMRRISALFVRGVVTRVDDGAKLQLLQCTGLAREQLDRVERFQPYGLSAHPEAGAEVLLACVGGNREHAIAIAVDDRRHRPTGLAAGEVTLYSKHGQSVLLKADGSVEVTSSSAIKLAVAGTSIEIAASGVTITSPTGTTTFQ
jgi:phage baseplate assembly protein V